MNSKLMSKFQDPVLYFVSDFIEVLSHICLWPFSMNAKRETKNSGINGRRLRRDFVPSSFLCKFTYLFTNLQIFPLAVNKDLRSVFPRGLCKDYMKRE